MSSVLIENMTVPESCGRCPFNYSSLYCVLTGSSIDRDDEYKERLNHCPIHELPPHGDLIDRDALRKVHAEAEKGAFGGLYVVGTNRFMKRFEDAPVVIPADKR